MTKNYPVKKFCDYPVLFRSYDKSILLSKIGEFYLERMPTRAKKGLPTEVTFETFQSDFKHCAAPALCWARGTALAAAGLSLSRALMAGAPALWPVLGNSVPKLGHEFFQLWLHFHPVPKNLGFQGSKNYGSFS